MQVGMGALNDAFLVDSIVNVLLHQGLASHPRYPDILHTFAEVSFLPFSALMD